MGETHEDGPLPADERITRIGLLMEAAIAHQRMAEDSVERLQRLAQSLDSVVRDEIRRTLVDECQGLTAECRGAIEALRGVKRAASLRAMLWSVGVTVACVGFALTVAWRILPSKPQITQLRAERDRLMSSLVDLKRQGGHLHLRRCGKRGRLCVRIDPGATAYGVGGDYRVVAEE